MVVDLSRLSGETVSGLDGLERLDAAIHTFELANEVGLFLDPTAWRDHAGDREAVLDLLRATRAFRAAASRFQQRSAEIIAKRGVTTGAAR